MLCLGVESGDANAPALLTIEAGVTLRFKREGKLEVEHFVGDAPASGALVAMGTQHDPITLTSAKPSPAAPVGRARARVAPAARVPLDAAVP